MKAKIVQLLYVLILTTLLVGSAAQPGFASASAKTSFVEQAATLPIEPIDPEELEAFLDDLMAELRLVPRKMF